MTRNLIIGSGPAAVGVALGLLAAGEIDITMIDIGASLEEDHRRTRAGVASLPPAQWPSEALAVLTQQPPAPSKRDLPQKRMFGSDFPFRDLGQLERLRVTPGGNASMVSAARGGFSNAWGAQVLPFTKATIDQWPIAYEELLPHYTAILRHIPYAGADDDYSELFPLLAPITPLPPLSPHAAAVLQRYCHNRGLVRRLGVTVGSARLAMDAGRCIECGLCLTGCPTGLVYSANQTVDALVRDGRIRYVGGMLALGVGEDSDGCWVRVRRVDAGPATTERADRLFVACGGLGSTRIVLNSARPRVARLELAESVQFVLPFMSARGHLDPLAYSTFTLNQVSMVVCYGRTGLDLAHLHLYPYNPTFTEKLPSPLRDSDRLATAVLRRTVAALGYLPSWASPRVTVAVGNRVSDTLPEVAISSRDNPSTWRTLAKVLVRLTAVAPALDLWPALPMLRVSGPGKSYHFGGSFPHVAGRPRAEALETDTLGRLAEWRKVHLVDGAVLPTVPATTFTLSVMANAHRIATAAASA